MKKLETSPSIASSTRKQASQLFAAHQQTIFKSTDHMFAVLMSIQWIAGVGAALWITPQTWIGTVSQTHIHVWASIFLGAAISILPITLALVRSGESATRHVIATAQILMSALLIYLTGGRIETHFHVFGSLAFLAFYRDWRVLVPATLVVAVDHFLRGVFWPQTVYGVLSSSQWRWLEHAGWVLFEDAFLYVAIKRSVAEMWAIAIRTAETRDLNRGLEQRVAERTRQIVGANEDLQREIIERKLAEAAVRDSEERYRLLFESNPLPMWVYDLETLSFLAVNDAAVNHYGFSRDEFLTMTIKDIRPSEEVPALLDRVSRASGGFSISGLSRHRKKDGMVIDVEVTWHALDFAGRPAKLALANDITERKVAEGSLRLSEERFRTLVQSARDAIVLADGAGNIISWNEGAQKIFGYQEQEILGKPLSLLMPKRYREAHGEGMSRFLTTGETRMIGKAALELQGLRKDGSEFPLELSLATWKTDKGVFFSGIIRDITERKRMEDQRQIISEIIQGAITSSDLDDFLKLVHHSIGKCLYAENCFVALYDEATELMHFAFWANKLDPCPAPRSVGIGFSGVVLRTGKPMLVDPELTEEMYRRGEVEKSGSSSASWLGVPLRTPARIIGALVVQHYEEENAYDERDMEFLTSVGSQIALAIERKRAETVLLQTEDQLRQSQKMKSIGTLAGGIAHDFNNLMTAVTGYSELALRSLDAADPLCSKIEEIKKAGERAASLTRQLLAFSRKQVLQPRVLDLNTVIIGMSKMLPRVIGEHIELRIELAASLDQVKADPGQMEQVLMNLAVNARDAMSNGGLLTIATRNVHLNGKYASRHTVLQAGHYAMLSVSDNGCGMNVETQTHIFEPFYTTKEVGKGTGLGLSMVYGIVKQSGGSIWVYSEEGKGTTFKIYLPRVDEVVATEDPGDSSISAPRGHETILLVEDEDVVRDLSKEILEDYGYAVIAAPNGQEGLRICREFDGQIDLVITDVVMPQMSGRELAESVGVLRPDARVLYMSGFTNDAVVRHGVRDDGMCFIQKPFSPDSLALKAREVLDQIGARENSGAPAYSLKVSRKKKKNSRS